MALEPDYTSRFYIRLRIRDQLGVIRVVGALSLFFFQINNLSVYACPTVGLSIRFHSIALVRTRILSNHHPFNVPVGEIAERHGVSIYAILQNPITDPTNIDFVVTTEPAKHSQIQAFADEISTQSFTKGPPVFFAFLL